MHPVAFAGPVDEILVLAASAAKRAVRIALRVHAVTSAVRAANDPGLGHEQSVNSKLLSPL